METNDAASLLKCNFPVTNEHISYVSLLYFKELMRQLVVISSIVSRT